MLATAHSPLTGHIHSYISTHQPCNCSFISVRVAILYSMYKELKDAHAIPIISLGGVLLLPVIYNKILFSNRKNLFPHGYSIRAVDTTPTAPMKHMMA